MPPESAPPSRCPKCLGAEIELVLTTTIATYWRCCDCGWMLLVEHEPRPMVSEPSSAMSEDPTGTAETDSSGCRCGEGWICELHSSRAWPDDDCTAPGIPCRNPNCPWWQGQFPAALLRDWSDVSYTKTGYKKRRRQG